MALDPTGATLAALIVSALPPILDGTGNPNPAATAAQLAFWTTISAKIITYIQTNAQVATTASVVSTVIAPSGGGPCTGALAATGTIE
jgi:hypothetical protein